MESETTLNRRNGLATTSLALGIAPICISLVLVMEGHIYLPIVPIGFAAALFGPGAIITGVASLKQTKKQGGRGKNLAIAGITLGTIEIGLVVLFVWIILSLFGFFGGKGI